jgi:abhydrolase domain-containing protein 12
MGIGSDIAVALSFVSFIWLPATLLCCLPWIQKREWAEESARAALLGHLHMSRAIAKRDVEMLYLHWVTMFPGKWLEEPERAGFLSASFESNSWRSSQYSCAAENQVTPFRIATKDGHRLFTWLVTPLGVYARHLDEFVREQRGVEDVRETLAFRLLRDDPEARLLLYFHGNAATLGQQRRTEEYRSYASGACEKIFVLKLW